MKFILEKKTEDGLVKAQAYEITDARSIRQIRQFLHFAPPSNESFTIIEMTSSEACYNMCNIFHQKSYACNISGIVAIDGVKEIPMPKDDDEDMDEFPGHEDPAPKREITLLPSDHLIYDLPPYNPPIFDQNNSSATIFLWKDSRVNRQIASADSGGHIAIRINKGEKPCYVDFRPDTSSHPQPSILSRILKQLHFPGCDSRPGRFVRNFEHINPQSKSFESKEIIIPCEHIPAEIEKAFTFCNELIEKCPNYNFYNNNCASIVLSIIKQLKPKTKYNQFAVTPTQVFDYAKEVAKEFEIQRIKQQIQNPASDTTLDQQFTSCLNYCIEKLRIIQKYSYETPPHISIDHIIGQLRQILTYIQRESLDESALIQYLIRIHDSINLGILGCECSKKSNVSSLEVMSVLHELISFLPQQENQILRVMRAQISEKLSEIKLSLTNYKPTELEGILDIDILLIGAGLMKYDSDANPGNDDPTELCQKIIADIELSPMADKKLQNIIRILRNFTPIFQNIEKISDSDLYAVKAQLQDVSIAINLVIEENKSDSELAKFYSSLLTFAEQAIHQINDKLYFRPNEANNLLIAMQNSLPAVIRPSFNQSFEINLQNAKSGYIWLDRTAPRPKSKWWQWKRKREFTISNTKQAIHTILNSDLSPKEKIKKINEIAHKNRPSRWLHKAEYQQYITMETDALLICWLEAFYNGQINEINLCKELRLLASHLSDERRTNLNRFISEMMEKYRCLNPKTAKSQSIPTEKKRSSLWSSEVRPGEMMWQVQPSPAEVVEQKPVTTKATENGSFRGILISLLYQPSNPGAYLRRDGSGDSNWLTQRGTEPFVDTESTQSPTESDQISAIAAEGIKQLYKTHNELMKPDFNPEKLPPKQRAQIIEYVSSGSKEESIKLIVEILEDQPSTTAAEPITKESPIVDMVYQWAQEQHNSPQMQACM